MKKAVELLQGSFQILFLPEFSVLNLELVLNIKRTKYMLFTRSHNKLVIPPILTLEGDGVERVNTYKYLGIWLDERLGFNIHIENLSKKLRPKLGFLFRLKKCLPFEAKKENYSKLFTFCAGLR